MLRRLGGVVAGMATALFVVVAMEALGAAIWPLPEGIDPHDAASMRAALSHIPAGALVLVLVGWALGTFAGSFVAGKIARSFVAALGVGLLQLVGGIVNMAAIPHPGWFWIAGPIALLAPAWVGGRLAVRGTV
jgi:hypothetical protein